MRKALEITVAANVTYLEVTFNTKLHIEYEHTGVYYFIKKKNFKYILSGEESAIEKRNKGKKVYVSDGYYLQKRFAIPAKNNKGENDIWYINNCGDIYSINKTSRYAKKIHADLSKENISTYNPY